MEEGVGRFNIVKLVFDGDAFGDGVLGTENGVVDTALSDGVPDTTKIRVVDTTLGDGVPGTPMESRTQPRSKCRRSLQTWCP